MQSSLRGVVWLAWGGVALLLGDDGDPSACTTRRSGRLGSPRTSISHSGPPRRQPAPRRLRLRPKPSRRLRYRLSRSKRPGGYRRPRPAGRPGSAFSTATRRSARSALTRAANGCWCRRGRHARRPPALRRGHEPRHRSRHRSGGRRGPPVARHRRIVGASARARRRARPRPWPCCWPASRARRRASCSARKIRPEPEVESCRSTRPNMAGRTSWSCPAMPGRGRGSTSMPAGSCSAAPRRTKCGKWALRSTYRTPTGGVGVRLDRLAADGTVAHRVAAPLNLPTGMSLRDGDTYVCRARQQPVADRPPCLWPGRTLHRDLCGQPEHDPRSASDLSGTGAEAAATLTRLPDRPPIGHGPGKPHSCLICEDAGMISTRSTRRPSISTISKR